MHQPRLQLWRRCALLCMCISSIYQCAICQTVNVIVDGDSRPFSVAKMKVDALLREAAADWCHRNIASVQGQPCESALVERIESVRKEERLEVALAFVRNASFVGLETELRWLISEFSRSSTSSTSTNLANAHYLLSAVLRQPEIGNPGLVLGALARAVELTPVSEMPEWRQEHARFLAEVRCTVDGPSTSPDSISIVDFMKILQSLQDTISSPAAFEVVNNWLYFILHNAQRINQVQPSCNTPNSNNEASHACIAIALRTMDRFQETEYQNSELRRLRFLALRILHGSHQEEAALLLQDFVRAADNAAAGPTPLELLWTAYAALKVSYSSIDDSTRSVFPVCSPHPV
jgi:hypothetical protein